MDPMYDMQSALRAGGIHPSLSGGSMNSDPHNNFLRSALDGIIENYRYATGGGDPASIDRLERYRDTLVATAGNQPVLDLSSHLQPLSREQLFDKLTQGFAGHSTGATAPKMEEETDGDTWPWEKEKKKKEDKKSGGSNGGKSTNGDSDDS
jgi:hypothetical protein